MLTLASTLVDDNKSIFIDYNAESGIVKTELLPEEISVLYRRLPLHRHFHHYELTASTHLLNILAECMKYARTEKLEPFTSLEMINPIRSGNIEEAIATPSNIWDFHINFYDAIFPVLDALADLEEIINRFEDKIIIELSYAINRYETKVHAIFSELKTLSEKGRYQENMTTFETRITEDIERFRKNIKDNNKPENKRALLSNHIITNGIFPLGHFVIEQVERVAVALAQFRRIHEKYSGKEDYIEKSPDCQKIDVFLDDTLAFKKSFAGIRFSTEKPIPKETITVLRVAGGNYQGLNAPRYDVILNDFVKPSEQADSRAWVKLFCQISGSKPPSINSTSAGLAALINSGLIVATPLEIGVFFPIRIFLVLVVGVTTSIIKLCLNILNKIKLLDLATLEIYEEKIQTFLEDADETFDRLYYACSRVGFLRKKRDDNQPLPYEALVSNNNEEQLFNFLKEIAMHRKNSIAYFVKENFKASFVDQSIVSAAQSIVHFFYEATIYNPSYLSSKLRHHPNDVLVTLLNDLTRLAPNTELNKAITLPINRLWGLLGDVKHERAYGLNIGGQHAVLTLDAPSFSTFPRIQACPVGPSNSIMGFAEMLGLEFASLINGVYIKMPLASTIAMSLAIVAWFYTCSGSGGFIPEIINWLSKSFTGEGAVSIIRITLASFLLWKVATLTIEAGIALLWHWDPDFLEKLYGDPERLFLVFSCFLGLGIALQLLPLLPDAIDVFPSSGINAILSMYLAMANIFITEARVAWHGQIPLNFLEYFFLGLKATFLFGAVISGEHKAHLDINEAELEKIIFQLNYLSARHELDRAKVAHYIVRLYGALGLPIERQQARHLFDELSVNARYPETSKELYNQSIYRGSNNLLQILSLLPGVFITYPYRFIMVGFAHYLNAPVIKHGIEKSFAEDFTLFIQVAAAMSETFRTFLLGVNQLVKSGGALTAALLIKLNYLSSDFKSFNQNTLARINIHNNILWPMRKLLAYGVNEQYLNFFKSSYGLLTHIANTNQTLEHAESSETLRTALLASHDKRGVSLRSRHALQPHRASLLPKNIKLNVDNLELIRIKEKSGGKNKGGYDGTYVTRTSYVNNNSSDQVIVYSPEEIFFLKMFPNNESKLVEGFSEALLGKIITEMINQGFISKEFHHCFSPARIVQLPCNAGAALLQPFLIGYTELFKKIDNTKKAKSSVEDLFDRMTGVGYAKFFDPTEEYQDELSYIIMIMVLFGNYSLHAGNILFRKEEHTGKLLLNVIDYGAAFRNYMGALKSSTPLQSLEEQLPRYDGYIFKKYLDSYKTIPGLFDAVSGHATAFNQRLQQSNNQQIFKELISGAFKETYDAYKLSISRMYSMDKWESKLKGDLLNNLTGKVYKKLCGTISGVSSKSSADPEREFFAKVISSTAINCLEKMSTLSSPSNQNCWARIWNSGSACLQSQDNTAATNLSV